jgi:hypothetical protein
VDPTERTEPPEAQRVPGARGDPPLAPAPELDRLASEAEELIDRARRLREESLSRARAGRPIQRRGRP